MYSRLRRSLYIYRAERMIRRIIINLIAAKKLSSLVAESESPEKWAIEKKA